MGQNLRWICHQLILRCCMIVAWIIPTWTCFSVLAASLTSQTVGNRRNLHETHLNPACKQKKPYNSLFVVSPSGLYRKYLQATCSPNFIESLLELHESCMNMRPWSNVFDETVYVYTILNDTCMKATWNQKNPQLHETFKINVPRNVWMEVSCRFGVGFMQIS